MISPMRGTAADLPDSIAQFDASRQSPPRGIS
jgi:hypothetical protein